MDHVTKECSLKDGIPKAERELAEKVRAERVRAVNARLRALQERGRSIIAAEIENSARADCANMKPIPTPTGIFFKAWARVSHCQLLNRVEWSKARRYLAYTVDHYLALWVRLPPSASPQKENWCF